MGFRQKTLDVLDAGLAEKYDRYMAAPIEMRERFFTEGFWLEASNWEKYYAELETVNFNWQEFKYNDISADNPLDKVITSDETGIYMFIVKSNNTIFDLPKFVLYVGMSGENNSKRSLKERLKDYYYIEKVKKRDAVLRLLQKYHKNVYVAYSLLQMSEAEIRSIETSLLGFFYPKPNKDDFPVELKPLKKGF